MSGGLIRIGGNAGGQIGAAYRGSHTGMRDGTILVGGTAGLEVGMRMKRGIIAVRGPVRDFAGLQMKGGTIVLGSGAELRTGAWMMRGTIISLRRSPLMPTFSYAATYVPGFLRIYASLSRRAWGSRCPATSSRARTGATQVTRPSPARARFSSGLLVGRERRGVEIVDTFAEAFDMRASRVIITAASEAWARTAAMSMTGFATSVIGCKVEAGIEAMLAAWRHA